MITLKASNKDLVRNAPFSYLITNYASGITSLEILNAGDFAADDYVLLGEFGHESAEIVQIGSLTDNVLTLKAATKFAHAESTRATRIGYNQVRFYYTATTTFDTDTPVGSVVDVQADNLFTRTEDSTNTTGYGWFAFYNSTKTEYSTRSNYIPYQDFPSNSIKKIADHFLKPLSQKEAEVISFDDILTWVSEGVSLAQNLLNEANREYKQEDAYTLTTLAGTGEYDLPVDFSEMISVWGKTEKARIGKINTEDIDQNNETNFLNTCYYLRGKKIGFSPVPTAGGDEYILRYLSLSKIYTSLTDTVDLPGNGHFLINEYLLYKAALPLKRYDGETHLAIFTDGIKSLTITAQKRDSERENWGVDNSAMV